MKVGQTEGGTPKTGEVQLGKQGEEHCGDDQEGWRGPGLCGVLPEDMNT